MFKKDDKKTPRGKQDDLTHPESDAQITPPSQKRPLNPSDEIEYQIEAADARTKAPGNEFEKFSDEQLKDYAVKKGIDGNDGLNRAQIIEKIQTFEGKRMFDDPAKNEQTETSAETAERVKREGLDADKEPKVK